jgi:hypothetical protein
VESPRFVGGLSIFGPCFGAPICDQLVGETSARCQVCEQTSYSLRRLPASFFFGMGVFGCVGHGLYLVQL